MIDRDGKEGGGLLNERHDVRATFHYCAQISECKSPPATQLVVDGDWRKTTAPTATHAPRAGRQPHVRAVQSQHALWRGARTCALRVSPRAAALSATAHPLRSARRLSHPTSLPERRRIKLSPHAVVLYAPFTYLPPRAAIFLSASLPSFFAHLTHFTSSPPFTTLYGPTCRHLFIHSTPRHRVAGYFFSTHSSLATHFTAPAIPFSTPVLHLFIILLHSRGTSFIPQPLRCKLPARWRQEPSPPGSPSGCSSLS